MNIDKSSTPIYFYEFVALVIPGSALLFFTQIILGTPESVEVLAPQSLSGLSLHIFLAYIVGSLLQVIGNYIDQIYWFFLSGNPINWPITNPSFFDSPEIVKLFSIYSKKKMPTKPSPRLKVWKEVLDFIKSAIYANNLHERLHIFLGHYGFIRGLLAAAFIIILEIYAFGIPVSKELKQISLAIIILLFIRLRSFGINYAEELFAIGLLMAKNHARKVKVIIPILLEEKRK